MAANRTLATIRGLSEEQIRKIDAIHEQIEKIIEERGKPPFDSEVYDTIENLEFRLQELWGFPKEPTRHTWKRKYGMKATWIGRKFRCRDTGEEFTIPEDVVERDYFKVGNGAIDLGRLFGYYRILGNVEEI